MRRVSPPSNEEAPAVRVPVPAGEVAPWLAITRGPVDDPLALPKILSEGESAAIARAGDGFFAITTDRGVVGPLEVPAGVLWVGLGGGDRVFAGSAARAAYSAPTVEAAARGGFVPTAELAGIARAWDANGDVLAAVTSVGVELSTDGGSSWAVAIDEMASGVFVRHDGVIAAQVLVDGSLVTRVSRDRGASWTDARYQPGLLSRWGAWIIEDNTDCPVVLADDGEHWVAAEDIYDVLGGRPYWLDALRTETKVVPFAADGHVTATDPPAPAYRADLEAVGTARPCAAPVEEPMDGEPVDDVAVVYPDRPMPRVVGTVGARPWESLIELELLSDGACGDGDDVRDGAPACPRDAPPARAPHAVVLDRGAGAVTLLDLPDGCWPVRSLSAAGLGMVACREGDRATVWGHAGLGWQEELVIDLAEAMSARVNAAADGTIGLFPSCFDQDCVIYVRVPVDLGAAGAWRRVAIGGALAYRVLTGGHVLAIAEAPAGRVRFERVDESGSSALLADSVDVPADATGVEVSNEHIVVRLASGATRVLTADGALR